jgi:hypothetical protein
MRKTGAYKPKLEMAADQRMGLSDGTQKSLRL